MAKERKVKPSDRRDFLKLASLGAVAGAAVAASGTEAKAATPVRPGDAGYQETAHVRKAYALSRF